MKIKNFKNQVLMQVSYKEHVKKKRALTLKGVYIRAFPHRKRGVVPKNFPGAVPPDPLP